VSTTATTDVVPERSVTSSEAFKTFASVLKNASVNLFSITLSFAFKKASGR